MQLAKAESAVNIDGFQLHPPDDRADRTEGRKRGHGIMVHNKQRQNKLREELRKECIINDWLQLKH